VKQVRRLLVLLVVAASLAPALAMLVDSLRGPEGWSLRAFGDGLTDARRLGLLGRSVLVALGSSALALVWGIPVGYVAASRSRALGSCVETLSLLPLLLPSLVTALGFVHLFGRAGVVTVWLRSAFDLQAPPFDLYTPAGAAWILSLCNYPCVSILAAQGFRSIDPASVRAARLAAGPWQRLWGFWRPLLMPWLVRGALLVFLLSFADFGVPSALMVNVYPIEVFTELSAYLDVRRAIAVCAPPAAVALLFVVVALGATRAPWPLAGRTGNDLRSKPWAVAAALLVLTLSLGLPLLVLLWTAQGAYGEALRTAGEQVLTSLRIALLGTGMLLAAGGVFAWACRGLLARGQRAAELAVLLPLLVPGAVVGLGILRLVTAGVWPFAAIHPGEALVAYGAAARFVAIPALLLAAAATSLHAAPLDAARVHGAGRWRVFTGILLPLLWPAVAGAATLSFLFCLGELPAAVLVNPPGVMTLPVRLASLLHFGKDALVAALCVILCGLVAAVLLLGLLLTGGPIRPRLRHAYRAD
jgi:ABC-type Fe3+ transport system permease subunit